MKFTTIGILLLALILLASANQSHLKNNSNSVKRRNAFHKNKFQHDHKLHEKTQNLMKLHLQNKVDGEVQAEIDGESQQVSAQIDVNQDGEQETDIVDVSQSEDGQIVAKYVSPVKKTPETAWEVIATNNDTFETFYAAYKTQLQDDLDALIAEKSQKTSECNSYGALMAELEANIEKSSNYITWLSEKVAENTAKIDKIFAERCEAHQIFIEYYKNAKITIRLVSFLKEAVTNYSMVQLKQVGNILTEFMNPRLLNNTKAMQAMLTQLKEVDGTDGVDQVGSSLNTERQRTQEEIGDKHIDNSSDKIEVEQFESSEQRLLNDYKVEIIQILEDIRAKTQAEIDRRQNDEIELNDRVVKFVEKMEIENATLNMEADNAREASISMQDELITSTYLQETCDGDLQWLQDEIDAQTTIQTYVVENTEEVKAQYDALIKSQQPVEPTPEPISVVIDGEQNDGESNETQEVVPEVVPAVVEPVVQEENNDPETTNWVPGDEPFNLADFNKNVGIKIPTSGQEKITVGLAWESGPTDLDSSIVAADVNYDVVDKVYWNNLVSSDYSIEHLGDARSGGLAEDTSDDEQINIFLNSVDSNTQTLFVVTSIYDDDNLVFYQDVSMSSVTLYVDGKVFSTYEIDPSSSIYSEWATSYILVELYRNEADEGNWYVRITDVWIYQNPDKSPIRHVNQPGLAMQIKNIGQGTYIQDTSNWQTSQGTFTLPYGGNGLAIPAVAYNGLTLGLSWDAENIDIDSSIIIADGNQRVTDRVYWGKAESDDSAIAHQGDALDGNAEGDDETITLKLLDVSQTSSHLYVLLTIYDESDSQYFQDVQNMKVNLYVDGTTFLSFQLDPSQIEKAQRAPGYVLVEIYRNESQEGNWWIRQVGEFIYKGPSGFNMRTAEDDGVDVAIESIKLH